MAIPALNPDERLIDLAEALIAAGVRHIVVVDDGSKPECGAVFAALAKLPECTVIVFPVNRGKGAGLKAAFRWYLEHFPDGPGVVAADADGQHPVADILRIAAELEAHPGSLVMGVRDFFREGVPFKSRYGNLLTRLVFRGSAGVALSDTQTGLRGVAADFMPRCLEIAGERFEYETDMLFVAAKNGVPIREVPIATVYENDNKGTHFHPFRDAARIYRVIWRHFSRQMALFIASSLASMAVDLGLFALLFYRLLPELPHPARLALAVVGARLVSGTLNYCLNRRIVFAMPRHCRTGGVDSATGYCLLSAIVLFVSYTLTACGEFLLPALNLVLVKALVDFSIFLINFFVQKLLIFRIRN